MIPICAKENVLSEEALKQAYAQGLLERLTLSITPQGAFITTYFKKHGRLPFYVATRRNPTSPKLFKNLFTLYDRLIVDFEDLPMFLSVKSRNQNLPTDELSERRGAAPQPGEHQMYGRRFSDTRSGK